MVAASADDLTAASQPVVPNLPPVQRRTEAPRMTVIRFETLPPRPPENRRSRVNALPAMATVEGPTDRGDPYPTRLRPPHVRLAWRSWCAQIGLVFVVAVDLLVLWALWLDQTGSNVRADPFRLAIASAVVHGVCAVTFVAWFFRAYDNARIFARTAYGSGWAIIGWLIPVFNLFRPMQVATDLVERTEGGPSRVGSGLVLAWWFLWISAPIVSAIGLLGETSDEIHLRLMASTLLLYSASALTALLLVRRISRLQDALLDARLAVGPS